MRTYIETGRGDEFLNADMIVKIQAVQNQHVAIWTDTTRLGIGIPFHADRVPPHQVQQIALDLLREIGNAPEQQATRVVTFLEGTVTSRYL
ncbi:hypothetical protein [Nocardia aurantia]|uniref:Uncharacterized protein n=1 Tax=Nocardia aurantia TaxID=2585199 RepID=A0A7K0DNC3_9NOCA|nr:hypothetical protein [Nocardia aurantia]MQY27230.1 hypothetical protein [Nocardia aurantia]